MPSQVFSQGTLQEHTVEYTLILAFELVFASIAVILSLLSFLTIRAIKHLGVGKAFWVPVLASSVLFVFGSVLTMLYDAGVPLTSLTLEAVYVSRIAALSLLVGGIYSYSRKIRGSLHEEFTIPEQLIQERRNMAPVDQSDEASAASIREEHRHEAPIEKRGVQESAPKCQHRLGYLRTLPKNAAIPDECLGCDRIIECKHSFVDPLENRPQRA